MSEELRDAIRRCGQTRYRIAQETGVNESTLSRFVASGKGLSVGNADVLCEYLGLVLRAKRNPRRAKDR